MARERALLAWEAGAGRGHVVTLATLARALCGRFTLDAALRRLDHAREIAGDCALVFRGPPLPYRPPPGAGRPTASWGDYLGDIGFADPAFIAARVDWWQRLMRERGYRLLVADYAPCAMLAARGLGLPVVAVGTGFGLPPGKLDHFPDFLPHGPHARRHDEAGMVAGLNSALMPLGVPPLRSLPELYDCAAQIVRTPPPLDPYASWRSEPAIALHSLPLATGEDPAGQAILLYLSAGAADGGGLPEACLATGQPIIAYAPVLDTASRERLARGGARVLAAPLPPDRFARECGLMVHHGQPGMALAGLAAAMPQVVLPQHGEQRFHARALETLVGPADLSALPPAEWPGFLRQQALEARLRQRTAAARAALDPFLQQDHAAMLAERLARLAV